MPSQHGGRARLVVTSVTLILSTSPGLSASRVKVFDSAGVSAGTTAARSCDAGLEDADANCSAGSPDAGTGEVQDLYFIYFQTR